jgi:hypothetical protein
MHGLKQWGRNGKRNHPKARRRRLLQKVRQLLRLTKAKSHLNRLARVKGSQTWLDGELLRSGRLDFEAHLSGGGAIGEEEMSQKASTGKVELTGGRQIKPLSVHGRVAVSTWGKLEQIQNTNQNVPNA